MGVNIARNTGVKFSGIYKNLYDTEIDRIKTIHKQINFYQHHLNTVLKFDFADINRDNAQVYLKKVIGRAIKQLTTDTDIVGLIAIFRGSRQKRNWRQMGD